MEENLTTRNSSEFLKTDKGKARPASIEIPSISLPDEGGVIKGIDEKFTVNAVNGTPSFSIPLPVSSVRGVTPDLSVSYDSGAGNGIAGLRWSIPDTRLVIAGNNPWFKAGQPHIAGGVPKVEACRPLSNLRRQKGITTKHDK